MINEFNDLKIQSLRFYQRHLSSRKPLNPFFVIICINRTVLCLFIYLFNMNIVHDVHIGVHTHWNVTITATSVSYLVKYENVIFDAEPVVTAILRLY